MQSKRKMLEKICIVLLFGFAHGRIFTPDYYRRQCAGEMQPGEVLKALMPVLTEETCCPRFEDCPYRMPIMKALYHPLYRAPPGTPNCKCAKMFYDCMISNANSYSEVDAYGYGIISERCYVKDLGPWVVFWIRNGEKRKAILVRQNCVAYIPVNNWTYDYDRRRPESLYMAVDTYSYITTNGVGYKECLAMVS